MREAEILRRTMTDRAEITRQVWNGAEYESRVIYPALPCALSRSSHTASPRLRGEWENAAESGFTLMLYLPRGTVLRAGDRASVLREEQRYSGICSTSIGYPGFALSMLTVQEVCEA